MAIDKDLLDQLLSDCDPDKVFAKDGLLDDLKKALSERILNAELDEHLDGERGAGNANRRNGNSQKSALTGTSKMIAHALKAPSPPRWTEDQAARLDTTPDEILKAVRRGWLPEQIEAVSSKYALEDHSPPLKAPKLDGPRKPSSNDCFTSSSRGSSDRFGLSESESKQTPLTISSSSF